MTALIATIGRITLVTADRIGAFCIFTYSALFSKNHLRYGFHRTVVGIYTIGASSLPFIASIALFTGFILALQGYHSLTRFGAESLLGNAIAITLIRELAPVFTALMLIARAGSATTSHLAVMRITEQIQALHVHNISPVLFLVRPTIFAFLISTPILTLFFIAIALISGYYFAIYVLYIPSGVYVNGLIQSTSFTDIIYSMTKAFIFALLISSLMCYIGYNVTTVIKEKGASAIRIATTKSVVFACIAVLIANYILTSILFT